MQPISLPLCRITLRGTELVTLICPKKAALRSATVERPRSSFREIKLFNSQNLASSRVYGLGILMRRSETESMARTSYNGFASPSSRVVREYSPPEMSKLIDWLKAVFMNLVIANAAAGKVRES